jgi:pSer/pThr/pTyr-binding forkhead associated (FHA) protein
MCLLAIQEKLTLNYSVNGRSKSCKLSGKVVTIGRASNNTLKLNDSKISRNHAKIEMDNNRVIFYDLGSTRGSKVNNEAVTKRALRVGDQIAVGATVLTLASMFHQNLD